MRALASKHQAPPAADRRTPPYFPGEPIGFIEIPRLSMKAVFVEGTELHTLLQAPGHIPGTAPPGQPGNVGLAGHRDTHFRALQRIEEGDVITLTSLEGSFQYLVESTRIVAPGDTAVLGASVMPSLTLVSCYPFDYIGTAPKRFIVHGRQVGPFEE